MSTSTILSGGRIIDPAQNLNRIADLRLADGKIAEIGADLAQNPAYSDADVIDVSDLVVTPGFIDLHVHAYGSLGFSRPNTIGIDQGVTSYVEAGGPGPSTFNEYRAVMDGATVADLYCMLWFRPIGLIGIGHVEGDIKSLMKWEISEWMDTIEANRDNIKYLKTAAFGNYGVGPLRLGKGLAQILGIPTYAHIGDFQVTPEKITTKYAFELAEKNDVVTHIYHKNLGMILDDNGKVIPQVKAAKQRGALFDIGFGAQNFAFDIAEQCIAQDVITDIISSDLQQFNVLGPTYSLAHCMTCFLPLGFSVEEIIERVTIAPARALSIEDKAGSLKPGMPADVTVLRIEEGEFVLDDCFEATRVADQRFRPVMAFKNGQRYDSDLESACDERNWILQIVEDDLPQAAARLSGQQREFLGALVKDLEAEAWTDADIDLNAATAVQNLVYARQRESDVSLQDAINSVYQCFLDDAFTYQIGLFITRMNRSFALERMRAVAAA